MTGQPKTLMEAIRYFSDADIAREYVAAIRWPEGVACPTCGSMEVRFLKTRGLWECKTKHARKQFSVKVGTIFEDSPVALDKWLAALWMLVNDKNGISSYELGKSIGVTQATGWFMLQRLRLALEDGTFNKLQGEVEADETYIGGKARNMHFWRRQEVIKGKRGGAGKAAVFGVLEREGPNGHSRVRTSHIENARRHTLEAEVRKYVEEGSILYTDGLQSYRSLGSDFEHAMVEHDAQEYVRDGIHTNGMENFWALLKRALNGTYVSVEPFHLFRYLDEQVFRFNTRAMSDSARFHAALKGVIGKRLTYEQLTQSGASPA